MAYDKEFIQNALKTIKAEGLSLQESAKRFDVPVTTISAWKRKAGLTTRARRAVRNAGRRNVVSSNVPAFFAVVENARGLSMHDRYTILKTYFSMN